MEKRQHDTRLTTLYEISQLIVGTTDPDRATLEVFTALQERLNVLGGMLGLRNRESGRVEIVAAFGFPSHPKKDPHYRFTVSLIESVMESGYPQVIADVRDESDLGTSLSDIERTWAICVPVRVRGRTTGALMVEQSYSAKEVAFEDEVNFLKVVAALVGQAHEMELRLGFSGRKKGAGRMKEEKPIMVGESLAIRNVLETVEQVGPGGATVLIRGESGTGKELVASALHQVSPRCKGPFVKVVCAALPETLLETALFGHEKGAFTGAVERKSGFLEEASGGTLFFDEIGEISHSTQVKLLRFLQERTFETVGGVRPISVDVRIIAATNQDLEEAIHSGRFREDLYYRLNVVPIMIPPLRERVDDIPILVEHFVKELSLRYHKEIVFAGDAIRKMKEHNWPGNVRELENFVERLMVLAPDRLITAKDITLPRARPRRQAEEIPMPPPLAARPTLQEVEREQVIRALETSGGIQNLAAKQLGITPRQLAYRMKKYNIARAGVKYE